MPCRVYNHVFQKHDFFQNLFHSSQQKKPPVLEPLERYLKSVTKTFQMPFRLITIFSFCTFLFIITNMAFQTHIGIFFTNGIGQIPYGDKTLHFLIMATFSFLLNGCFRFRSINILNKNAYVGSLFILVFITLEECSQAVIPARNFEIMDMLCNYAGILSGSLLSTGFLYYQPSLAQSSAG